MLFYLVFTYSITVFLILFASRDNIRIKEISTNPNNIYTGKIIFGSKYRNLPISSIVWGGVLVVLIIVLGMRNVQTGDSQAYQNLFEVVNAGSSIIHPPKSNFLYDWLCRIVYLTGGSNNAVFLIVAVITLLFFSKGLKYSLANRFLYISLFMLSFQYYDLFNIVRQGIVDAIGFYAVCRVLYEEDNGDKKNTVFTTILLLISCLMHVTGVVFVLLYLLIKIYRKKIPFLLEVIILILYYGISSYLASSEVLSDLLGRFFGATWRAGKYNVDMQLGLRELGEGVVAVAVWIFYNYKYKTFAQKWLGFLTWCFAISRFMSSNFRILYRIADCFIPFFLLALLELPCMVEKKKIKRVIYISEFVFYICFFYFKIKGYTSYHGYNILSIEGLFR